MPKYRSIFVAEFPDSMVRRHVNPSFNRCIPCWKSQKYCSASNRVKVDVESVFLSDGLFFSEKIYFKQFYQDLNVAISLNGLFRSDRADLISMHTISAEARVSFAAPSP